MSNFLNQPLLQICFTVDDLDEACKMWTEAVGAGPWVRYPSVEFKSLAYQGKPSKMEQGGAIAFWGPIEIELYRRNDGSPAHCIFPQQGEAAFHHMCMMAKPNCYDDEIKRLEGLGYKKVWECVNGLDQRICWIDTRALNGAMIELYEYNEERLQGMAAMRELQANWDGKELFMNYTPDTDKDQLKF